MTTSLRARGAPRSGALASPLRALVGFRTVAVHDYRRLDLAVVESIVEQHLDDLLGFVGVALRTLDPG